MGKREWKGIALPKGVKVNQDNGREPRVEIRFTYRATECRELSLEPTVKNIEYAGSVVAKVRHLIEIGQFRYGEHFPDSKRCALFNEHAAKETSVKVVLDEYLAHIKPLVAPRTYAHYEHLLELYVRGKWDALTADKLTVPNMLEWITKELAAQGKGKGLSLGTARAIMVPLHSALQHAVLMQRIDANPLAAISLSKVWPKDQRSTGYKPNPFTAEEQERLLAAASPEMRRMLTFWMWTGLRGEELVALPWSNVDLAKRRIYIDRTNRKGKIVMETKTEAGKRYVPLIGPALKAIQEQRAATQMKGGVVWECPATGKAWVDPERLKNTSWRNLLKRAKVAYRGPYQCRHTFASTMLTVYNEPLATVSKILGHANPGITLKFYTRMLENNAQVHGFDLRGDYDKVAA